MNGPAQNPPDHLRERAEEAEQLLEALRRGEVDALVRSGPHGDQVFTLQGADRPYRIMVEVMSEGAATLSAEGVILYSNRRLAEMLGAELDQVIGASIERYVAPGAWRRTRELIDKAGAGAARDSVELVRADGQSMITYVAMAALEHETEGALVAVFTDVSALKAVEKELRAHREHLEQTVASRTAELKSANLLLESANRELETFAYTVSHDLRAPLRAIEGFARILADDYAGALDAEAKRLIGVICENAGTMERMIDDILAISRAGRIEMSLAPVDMRSLAEAALQQLQPGLAGRDVRIEIGDLPPAHCDASMMQRVWQNLLDNALKYTAPKPQPHIEIGAVPDDDETVYFVRDNGVGFDMAHADKLWGIFQRLHGADFAGSGVGLAIVKRIVARHGGRVWADGKVGEGACFYFALPKSPEAVASAARLAQGVPPSPAAT